MKRKFNLLTIFALLLLSTGVKASEVLSVKVMNAKILDVTLSNITSEQKLFLKTFNGEVLFDITLHTDTFHKYFDMSQLKDGIYFIETENEYEVKISPILKNEQGINLVHSSVDTIFKPEVKLTNGMLNAHITNSLKLPFAIYIYDEAGDTLHKENIKGKKLVVKKKFDLTKFTKGTFTIIFEFKDRKFVREVTI